MELLINYCARGQRTRKLSKVQPVHGAVVIWKQSDSRAYNTLLLLNQTQKAEKLDGEFKEFLLTVSSFIPHCHLLFLSVCFASDSS